MSDVYVLTAAAEADLRDIIRHTRQRWGDAQVRSYIGKLQIGIERVALGQGFFQDMTALYPGLRMAHCEHFLGDRVFALMGNELVEGRVAGGLIGERARVDFAAVRK